MRKICHIGYATPRGIGADEPCTLVVVLARRWKHGPVPPFRRRELRVRFTTFRAALAWRDSRTAAGHALHHVETLREG